MNRSFKRRRPFTILSALIVVALVAARLFLSPENPPESSASSQTSSDYSTSPHEEPLREGNYTVQRVVDGDTLLMTNAWRVRLLGVDTPETVKPNHPVEPWGPEASQFTREFVKDGLVRLRFDREREDKYGRRLAYVFVGDRMLNEELILAGLSPAKTYFNYSPDFKRRFVAAEKEAQAARRGIWSKKPNYQQPN